MIALQILLLFFLNLSRAVRDSSLNNGPALHTCDIPPGAPIIWLSEVNSQPLVSNTLCKNKSNSFPEVDTLLR